MGEDGRVYIKNIFKYILVLILNLVVLEFFHKVPLKLFKICKNFDLNMNIR
jgi:hypothetical protein